MDRDDRDVNAGSVIEAVLGWADRRPDQVAIGFRGASDWDAPLSYADLRRATFGAAGALSTAGVEPGDRVVLAVDTGVPAVAGFLGALVLGAVPVMATPWLGGMGGGPLYLEKLKREAALVDARLVVVPAAMQSVLAAIGRPLLADDALRAVADSPPRRLADAGGDALCTIQLTSGSTGVSRAVRISNRNAIANAEALRDLVPEGHNATGVIWLPLFHDMGLHGALLFQLLYGNSVYLMPPTHFIRDPGALLDGIARYRPAYIVGPNFSYALLARALGRRAPDPELLSSIRCTWNGAEPIQAESIERFLAAAAPFGYSPGAMMPCYGLGEATLVVSCTRPGDGLEVDLVDAAGLSRGTAEPLTAGLPARVVSCGPPVRHMRVDILDEEGVALPERRVGEVACSGAAVSSGYLGDEEATRAVFRNGRALTGDLGYLAGGKLYLVGRKKEVLIVHGQKYAPQAVEWAAEKVDGVRRGRSAAFAVANPETGTEDVVIACESTLPPDQHADLIRKVTARVLEETGLKVAAHVFPAGIAPKTSSGKIMRGAAREMFLQWRAGGLPGA